MKKFSVLELCAGAGGQSLGVEAAGFSHAALVELDPHACKTLRHNRPKWKVLNEDINGFDAKPYCGVDLLCGGLPCPPFSKAGKQLGTNDERNLFPAAMRIVGEVKPKAVMIENVRGILDAVFVDFREFIRKQLDDLGYTVDWKLLNACDYGVSQLRPRVVFVAIRKDIPTSFIWPEAQKKKPKTVGYLLHDLMASGGWKGASLWRDRADEIAPTLVGGATSMVAQIWARLELDALGKHYGWMEKELRMSRQQETSSVCLG